MKNYKDQNLLQHLTTEEKLRLTTGDGFWQTAGVERLGVSPVTFADGPVGLRKEHNGETVTAVAFPSISKLACSFDPTLLREVGAAIAEQCRQEGVNVLLAPGLNIKRNPRCGRNFEYFSEDPLLTAELASAYIDGVHSQEVGVCVKHFAANNQEYGRRVCDSVVDERALREIYLAAFERVIKRTKPCAVMCSYNKLNGEYCSQNRKLLTDILRSEWEFQGIVISDWGATDDRAKGLAAGLDLQMPQGDLSAVVNAFADGQLCENDLDVAVSRALQLSEDFSEQTPRNADFNYQHNLVRRINADCTVLAKNSCNLLPFSKKDEIALIGALAEKPYFQGGGSSKVRAYKVEPLKQAFEQSDVKFHYARGYNPDGTADEQLLEEARKIAQQCEKLLLIVGCDCETEGADRATLSLPECQLKVLDAVTSVNSNVAVVVQSGAPVDVSWYHSVKSLLISYLDGENCCGVFDVVFGDACPTGRLAETWPLYMPDAEKQYSDNYKRALYRESIYVGYRYYSTANVPVAFPFGFGLSYNKFVWDNIKISANSVSPTDKLTVKLNVANCGKTEDAETVQIYVTNCDGRDFYAKRNLVAFKKVRLKGGEKKGIALEVDVADFASFDVNKGKFCVNGGKYVLTVARNSNDAGTQLTVIVVGENDTVDNSEKYPCYYDVGADFCPTEQQFAELYGGELPIETVLPFTVNSPLQEISAKRFGRHVIKAWTKNSPDPRALLALPLVDFLHLRKDLSHRTLSTLVDVLNSADTKSYLRNLFKFIVSRFFGKGGGKNGDKK